MSSFSFIVIVSQYLFWELVAFAVGVTDQWRGVFSRGTTMTPREFFDEIAEPNAISAINTRGDLRLAVNAIMTLDAFFGILHATLHANGTVKTPRDDAWKEELAQQNDDYRLLRDTAYALKHGELKDPKPRLVRRPDKLFTMPDAFQSNVFSADAFHVDQVWLETDDTDHRANELIDKVTQFARAQLSRAPVDPSIGSR